MNKYEISFTGRLNTSIGVLCRYTVSVEASSEKEAILKLYDKYEHITVTNIVVSPL